jgi:hypothetical protein
VLHFHILCDYYAVLSTKLLAFSSNFYSNFKEAIVI